LVTQGLARVKKAFDDDVGAGHKSVSQVRKNSPHFKLETTSSPAIHRSRLK
jgi:hypothetical protein